MVAKSIAQLYFEKSIELFNRISKFLIFLSFTQKYLTAIQNYLLVKL